MPIDWEEVNGTVMPRQLMKEYRAEGWWRDEVFAQHLYACLRKCQDGSATFLGADGALDTVRLDVLFDAALALACELRLDADRQGDELVTVYGGNTAKTCIALLGACLSGLPVLPIASYVPLQEARVRAQLIGADEFVNCTPAPPELSCEWNLDVELQRGCDPDRVMGQTVPAALEEAWAETSPDAVALVGQTAGTTSDPRFVLHSHNTIVAEQVQLSGAVPFNYPPILSATPVAHAIGLLGGLLVPLELGFDLHVMEVWNPLRALDYMRSSGVSCGSGLPVLCESLVSQERFSEDDFSRIGVAGLGGAAASSTLVRLLAEHGVLVYRSFGSTEHPSVTSSANLGPTGRLWSEGRALEGVEIRVVDSGGVAHREGEGLLQTRGPDLCIGTVDPGGRSGMDRDDGWFFSGDFGRIDSRGLLWDVAREGDIVKTHGSLINLTRVEALVGAVLPSDGFALIAVPSPRPDLDTDLVLLTTDDAVDLRRLRRELLAGGASRTELPSRVVTIDRIPLTAIGKKDRRELESIYARSSS